MKTLENFLEFELLSFSGHTIRVSDLVTVLIILLITNILLWVIKKAILRKNRFSKMDNGNTYALYHIIKYIIWVISIGVMLESIGIELTILLAGSAALLVGVGLGLQQTFNDVISGIILLSERSIKIDDVLEIDGDVVKIESIGLRTSKALNRDDISIIIPNSLITTSKVINWSHQSDNIRFKIDVGVAYGSDVDSVIKVLEESVYEYNGDINREIAEARLINFGNSSLDFELLFFSKNIFRIGKAKSDIRRIISKKLAENGITIPFPQVDLHVKSNDTLKNVK